MEELTTDLKILRAAIELFSKKGYGATSIRDIAKLAGTNIASLNYHYGSKENLFNTVVKRQFELLVKDLITILADETISLIQKLELISEKYTYMLMNNEEMPLFVLNEIRKNREAFKEMLQNAQHFAQSKIEIQLQQENIGISVADLIINLMALIFFPFLVKSLLVSSGAVSELNFKQFVLNRKESIVDWCIKTTNK